jgi:hypothetical protein
VTSCAESKVQLSDDSDNTSVNLISSNDDSRLKDKLFFFFFDFISAGGNELHWFYYIFGFNYNNISMFIINHTIGIEAFDDWTKQFWHSRNLREASLRALIEDFNITKEDIINAQESTLDMPMSEINELIIKNPDFNRTVLSQKLCELWDWRSPAGQIKDISARDLLRSLEEKGLIRLPAAKRWSRAPGVGADKIIKIDHDVKPYNTKLQEVTPLQIEIVTASGNMQIFKSYIDQYHYLRYARSVGESIKYFVYSNKGDILACLMFGASAWSCRARDEYIGWDAPQRKAGLHLITNNSRFLILPGVNIPHLASHILGAVARRVSSDWQSRYGHKIYLLETFVECPRFQGTCFKAANWKCIGKTTGMGRNCKTAVGELPIKDIYGYPLTANFREALTM